MIRPREVSGVDILVNHVLLTSRNGFAACAAEGCPWEDRFHGRDKYEQVPLQIRAAHAEHQLDLLAAAGFRVNETRCNSSEV